MKLRISCFTFLIILTLISNSWPAINISNARSIGLAGAYAGLARGVDAPLSNPANLGLTNDNRLSIGLINLGVSVYNNSFSKSQYEMYNGSYWSGKDIEDISNSIPADGMKIMLNGAAQLASFSSRRLAFTIEALMESKVKLVKDFFDLLLYTNSNKGEHVFDDCDGEAWIVMSYNLSGAIPFNLFNFQQFAVGATAKYLQGFGYFNIIETKGSRTTTSEGENAVGFIKMEYAGRGNGIAFDLGAAGAINSQWIVSLGIKNIISNIFWNKDARQKYYSFSMESVDLLTLMEEDSVIENEVKEEELSSISSSLPMELHLGCAYYHKKLIVTMELIQGFSDRPGTSLTLKLASGIEYRIFHWLPIRAGISVGGDDTFSSAIGLGFKIGHLCLDFGMSNRGGFILNNQKGVNMALSMGLWF